MNTPLTGDENGEDEGEEVKERDEPVWSVYLLLCDGRLIYTGITTDVARRLRQHRGELAGGAKFTRQMGRVELLYHTAVGNRRLASQAEYRLRKLSHTQKRTIARQKLGREALLTQLGLLSPHP